MTYKYLITRELTPIIDFCYQSTKFYQTSKLLNQNKKIIYYNVLFNVFWATFALLELALECYHLYCHTPPKLTQAVV